MHLLAGNRGVLASELVVLIALDVAHSYDPALPVDKIEFSVVLVFISEIDCPIALLRTPDHSGDLRQRIGILFVRTYGNCDRGVLGNSSRNIRIVR